MLRWVVQVRYLRNLQSDEGKTKVSKLSHLDRGYYQFHEKLVALGADVKRVEEEDDEN